LVVAQRLSEVATQLARHDSDLAKQLRRAAVSVPLNIAEAEHGRGGRGPASFAVAFGSARESRACVEVGVAMGYLSNVDAAMLDDLDHVIAMLYRLSR